MPRRTRVLRLGLWGCGNVGRQIADGCLAGFSGEVEVIGVLARGRSDRLIETAASLGAWACTSLEELLALGLDVVIEAASGAGLAELGPRILEAGIDLIALS